MAMTMQNDEEVSGQEELLQHLLQKGAGFLEEEKFDESLAVYAEIEQNLDKNNPESRKLIAGVHVRIIESLYAKCRFLLDRGTHDEVFSVCGEMSRFLADTDPDVRGTSREKRKKIVEDIYEESDFLLQHERADEASAIYKKIEQYFSKDEDPEVRSIVSRVFIKKYDAEKIAEKLAKKSAELAAETAAIKETLAAATAINNEVAAEKPETRGDFDQLCARIETLLQQQKYRKALALYDEKIANRAVNEYREEKRLAELRLALLDALNLACNLSFGQNNWKEGIAIYDEIKERFGEDEYPLIQETVAELDKRVLESFCGSSERLFEELGEIFEECSARFGHAENSPAIQDMFRDFGCWYRLFSDDYPDNDPRDDDRNDVVKVKETQRGTGDSGCSGLFIVLIILFVIILISQL
jgi:tetratricopeptide (TPR) repeat protein